MKLATLLALIFAMVAVLSLSPASAANTTVYNGSYCKPFYGSQSADFSYGNAILNLATSSRSIVCPVLLHGFANQTGATAYVYWLAQSANDSLYCTFRSLRPDGTVLQATSASRVGSGYLQLPSITLDNASYYITCILPSKGRVTAVQVDENT